jgi:hypothetical protein
MSEESLRSLLLFVFYVLHNYGTHNDSQKTKDCTTRTALKSEDELGC